MIEPIAPGLGTSSLWIFAGSPVGDEYALKIDPSSIETIKAKRDASQNVMLRLVLKRPAELYSLSVEEAEIHRDPIIRNRWKQKNKENWENPRGKVLKRVGNPHIYSKTHLQIVFPELSLEAKHKRRLDAMSAGGALEKEPFHHLESLDADPYMAPILSSSFFKVLFPSRGPLLRGPLPPQKKEKRKE